MPNLVATLTLISLLSCPVKLIERLYQSDFIDNACDDAQMVKGLDWNLLGNRHPLALS